ncbi:MAG: hypothetical protein IJ174_08115 [Clostridia bacterium]|nr:hypothetical protein [Clostridia bacterium]
MTEQEKKLELTGKELEMVHGGMMEKKSFMVLKDGEGAFGPFASEEEATRKAQELGDGWQVVTVWGF